MMKKIKILLIPFFLFLVICVSFGIYCTRSHVRNVALDYGKPKLYTFDEVKAAGNVLIEDFKTSDIFKGYKLKRLYYEEEDSRDTSRDHQKEMIVIRSYYKAGLFPSDVTDDNPFENKNQYWILGRESSDDPWVIEDYY